MKTDYQKAAQKAVEDAAKAKQELEDRKRFYSDYEDKLKDKLSKQPLSLMRLHAFTGETSDNTNWAMAECFVCHSDIGINDDYVRLAYDIKLAGGAPQQFSGINNHAVVPNVFVCWPCAERSRREEIVVDVKDIQKIAKGRDWWKSSDY